MRNLIFGGIGFLWGGMIILYSFFDKEPNAGGAYGTGRRLGAALGVALFGVGLFYLINGIRSLSENKPKRKRRKRKRAPIKGADE